MFYGAGISESAAYKDPDSVIFYYQANPDLRKKSIEFRIELEEKAQTRKTRRNGYGLKSFERLFNERYVQETS